MDRKWLYPYYVIAILVVVLYFFGCDSQSSSSFSLEVQVEKEEGTSIEVKGPEGRVRDMMRVSPTMEFAVTTENGRQTFRRPVSEGENTLTLSVSP